MVFKTKSGVLQDHWYMPKMNNDSGQGRLFTRMEMLEHFDFGAIYSEIIYELCFTDKLPNEHHYNLEKIVEETGQIRSS